MPSYQPVTNIIYGKIFFFHKFTYIPTIYYFIVPLLNNLLKLKTEIDWFSTKCYKFKTFYAKFLLIRIKISVKTNFILQP